MNSFTSSGVPDQNIFSLEEATVGIPALRSNAEKDENYIDIVYSACINFNVARIIRDDYKAFLVEPSVMSQLRE